RAAEAFHLAHEREYGQRFDAEIDVVNVRVTGVGLVPELEWPEIEVGEGEPEPRFERPVVFAVDGRPQRLATAFYDPAALRRGQTIDGPAIIEQYAPPTVVPPGLTAEIDRHGNIIVDCSRAAAVREDATGLSTPVLQRVIGGAFQSIAK